MSTKMNMTRDINGYNGFGLIATYDYDDVAAAANTVYSFTVPSNYPAWIVIFTFTPGSNFFVTFDGSTPTVPTGTVTNRPYQSFNPAGRQVVGGSIIKVITPDATNPYIAVEFQVIAPYQN